MDDSRFKAKIGELRTHLPNPDACLFLMHTPVGALQVDKWDYRIAEHVAVYGTDTDGKFRMVLFPEDAALSFPIEVKLKSEGDSAKTDIA